MLLIGAAAVVVLLLVGYFVFSGSDTPPQETSTAANTPATTPTTTPPPAVEPPPAPPVVAPDTTTAATPAPQPPPAAPPAGDAAAVDAALEKQLDGARRTARRQWNGGDGPAALNAAEAGLKLRADDPQLLAVVTEIAKDARTKAVAARASADTYGPLATSLPTFKDAEARMTDAEAFTATQRLPAATRLYWLAEQSFRRAADDAKAAEKAAADKAAADAKAAADKVAATPPTTKPAPPPAPPAAPPANADETAIRGVIERLAQAFTASDARTIAQLTGLNERQLARTFEQNVSSQQMTVSNIRVTVESATRARATAFVVHDIRPRAGQPTRPLNRDQMFVLEKRNGAWVIVGRK
jgi:hypothetical protein